ncbi:hypothetical protein AAHC03_01064 [Spirometra sp. Aus1]
MGSGDGIHVLLGLTGSVASIKAPELVSLLQGEGFTVNVVATKAAHHFFDKKDIIVPMYEDEDEFNCWSSRGDDVLHIKVLPRRISYSSNVGQYTGENIEWTCRQPSNMYR